MPKQSLFMEIVTLIMAIFYMIYDKSKNFIIKLFSKKNK